VRVDDDGIDAALADTQIRFTQRDRDDHLVPSLPHRRPQAVARLWIRLDEEDTAHGERLTRIVVEM
jgi:hypothetical protein